MFDNDTIEKLEQAAIGLTESSRTEALQAVWKEHGKNSGSAVENLPVHVRNNLGIK